MSVPATSSSNLFRSYSGRPYVATLSCLVVSVPVSSFSGSDCDGERHSSFSLHLDMNARDLAHVSTAGEAVAVQRQENDSRVQLSVPVMINSGSKLVFHRFNS